MARIGQVQATSSKRLKLQQCVGAASMYQNTNQSNVEELQVVTPTASMSESSPYQSVGDHILARILSFLVTPAKKTTNREGSLFQPQQGNVNGFQAISLQDDHYFRQESARLNSYVLLILSQDLSLVSKRWKTNVGLIMNAHVPIKIISPENLFELKCRALSLDLQAACQDFFDTIQQKWGSIVVDEDKEMYAFNIITRCFGGSEEAFVNLVMNEYVKFLVVKCVETLMRNRASRKETHLMKVWKESCQPPAVVRMFWQSHILTSPKKYAQDCNILFGTLLGETNSIDNILDHEPDGGDFRWESPLDGSDYKTKKNVLFQFEKGLPRTNTYFGRFGESGTEYYKLLFTEWLHVHQLSKELWENYRDNLNME